MQPATVVREPCWIRGDSVACFGWRHGAPDAPARDCVAIVCGPVGHEYTRAHRSLRHLADRLARAGIPALRFDYHGIGDSPGTDLDPGRVAAWRESLRAAVAHARAWSGRSKVALVGMRLGGTLTALQAAAEPVDALVLWNPVVKGRAYVRELQAIAMSAERGPGPADGALQSAGFIYTAETLADLKGLDLLAAAPRARRALVLSRDDIARDDAFAAHLAGTGLPVDFEPAAGWNEMMADHQFSTVPDKALARIVEWIGADAFGLDARRPANEAAREDEIAVDPGVREAFCRFGPGESLFGILARADDAPDRPVVLMFNGGSVHHVGPNRLYVALARRLAALGVPSLRFDMEGIGDSVLRGEGQENHPYRGNGIPDARGAIEHLRGRYGYARFVALGLCSGAHNAFHTRLALDDAAISELIMINPVTFYWREGMSLEGATREYDAIAYKKSMKDPARWLKLLRGDVNFRRLFDVALSYPRDYARKGYDALRETLTPDRGPPLARDLRRLAAMRCPVTVVIAEGDPGRGLLMSGAPRTAARQLRSGHVRLEMIPAADHTFTQWKPREDLIGRLAAHLGRQAAPARPGAAPQRIEPRSISTASRSRIQ